MMEPKRNADWARLSEPFRLQVHLLFKAMRKRRFDPVIFEGCRTLERQIWLYGVGRTHDLNRKPVTWTMHSKHLKCTAVDVISKKYWWGNAAFYKALCEEAEKLGLFTLYRKEQCHVQMDRVVNGSYSL